MHDIRHPQRARRRPGLLAPILLLAVAGCETATPYQPLTRGGSAPGAYSDSQIAPDRVRVRFEGNSMTSRETVATYLLHGAAQRTTQRLRLVHHRAAQHRTAHQNLCRSPVRTGSFGYWGPTWRYRSRAFGWRSWDPLWGDPFWDRSVDVRTVDRYEAVAEIVTGREPKPAAPRAFDARAVLITLGPQIRMPQDGETR